MPLAAMLKSAVLFVAAGLSRSVAATSSGSGFATAGASRWEPSEASCCSCTA